MTEIDQVYHCPAKRYKNCPLLQGDVELILPDGMCMAEFYKDNKYLPNREDDFGRPCNAPIRRISGESENSSST